MDTIRIPKNDKGYTVTFTVYDANGDAYDLSSYVVKCKAWDPEVPGTKIVDTTCTQIGGGTGGICTWLIAAEDTDVVLTMHAELEFTKTGIIESTIPFEIEIYEGN